MNRRRLFVCGIALVTVWCGVWSAAEASAGDFYRRMGIGYGAGYHAPAPFVQSTTHAHWSSWLHWKGACCHPGGMVEGCGCEEAAPCATCMPPTACGCGRTRHPGIY
jgi:hypothetical protein